MSKTIRAIILVIIGIIVGIWGWIDSEVSADTNLHKETATINGEIEYAPSLTDRPEQIINHEGYTVSYNQQWCLPNWVAYELTADETLGTVPRGDGFIPDPMVVGNTATTNDYKHSGYDRGHMAPAADMKWSKTAMDESFYLSNICPQNKNLNKGDWNDLEEQARKWATKYGSIYIACGPIVESKYKTIGQNNVAVPKGFFKVFMRKTQKGWTTIGFYFDNIAGNRKLDAYIRSIDEIESMTSIDFFPSLPDDIESEIESHTNIYDWSF